MADKMADVAAGLEFPILFLLHERKYQTDFSNIHDGLRKDLHSKLLFGVRDDICPHVTGQVLVWYFRKVLDDPLLEHIQRLSPQDTQLHPVSRVVLFIKFDKLVSDIDSTRLGYGLEGFEVARGEVAKGVFRVREGFFELMQAPLVVLQVLFVLRVHGAEFTVEGVFQEQRRNEELGETVQGTKQRRRVGGRWLLSIAGLS